LHSAQITQLLGQKVQHIYDDTGRIEYALNARGQKLDYAYEVWGPLKEQKDYPTASAPTPDRTVTYSRDNNGNITAVNDDSIQPGSLYTVKRHPVLRI
jgi:hypothetical protein